MSDHSVNARSGSRAAGRSSGSGPSAMPRYVALFSFALLLFAAVAFWPLYLSRDWAAIDRYTHTHALLGTLWLIVLMLQPILMLRGYRLAHRMVGRAAMIIAAGFVLSGLLLTHFRTSRMSEDTFAREGLYIYLPIAVAILFAVACSMGVRWRSSTPVHARFMLSTALLLVDPVIARIMFFYFPRLPSDDLYQGITFTLIATAMFFLVRTLPAQVPGRNGYRNYCIGAAATLALFFVVPYASPWLAFVNWFRVLPLT